MIEDVGPRGHDGGEGIPIATKIGNEDFDLASRDARANLRDGAGEDGGAAVGLVIAVDGRDDGIAQNHAGDGFGDALGFVFSRGAERLAAGDRAEPAGAGADVTENHEGGGAVFPALSHVGAARAFADGVEIERAHGALQFLIFRSAEEAHTQPGRARMRDGRRSGIGKNGEGGGHVKYFESILYAEEAG